MIIEDRVYGKHQITERVLMDLINSRAVQRLKGIAQLGLPDEWHHVRGFSRYEHSVGVLILLDRLKASLDEKIAGILHDVSHTAFSHVIDFVYGSERDQSFQDKLLSRFLDSPEIKSILGNYGYKPEFFHDMKKFTLLEQNIPELCADMIDYCLREMKIYGLGKEVETCLNSLVNVDGKICIRGEENALLFAREFLKFQSSDWGSMQSMNRYRILADMIKVAMDENIIKFDDLLMDDHFVIQKLVTSGNPKILEGIGKLTTGNFEVRQDMPFKLRYVDPLYVNEGGVLKRLSETNPDFRKAVSASV